jgi:hypothetical protein
MHFLTLEGLPKSFHQEVLKCVAASRGCAVMSPPSPMTRASTGDTAYVSLSMLLHKMRALQRAHAQNIDSIVAPHWIDTGIVHPAFAVLRVELADALSESMKISISKHGLVYIIRSPHECMETLACTGVEDSSMHSGMPTLQGGLGSLLESQEYLMATARGSIPSTPFPHVCEIIYAPPYSDDNPIDADALVQAVVCAAQKICTHDTWSSSIMHT